MKYLIAFTFVVIMTLIIHGLSTLFNEPTDAIYGPFLLGVVAFIVAEQITEGKR